MGEPASGRAAVPSNRVRFFVVPFSFFLLPFSFASCSPAAPYRAAFEEVPYARNAPVWAACEMVLRDRMARFVGRVCDQGFGDPPDREKTLSLDDQTEIPRLWVSYYWMTGDRRVFGPMNLLAERLGRMPHGYYAGHDTEHGSEPYYGLLAPLCRADPSNRENLRRLEDMAHHLGNWVGEVPPWYDAQRRHIRSMHLGTERVDVSENRGVDYPYNLRYAWVALAAHDLLGDVRYLEWAKEYLGEWARDIEANHGVCPSEVSIPEHRFGGKSGRWSLLAENPNWCWEGYGFKTVRAIDVFTDLYRATGDPEWLRPVKSHCRVLLEAGEDGLPAEAFREGKWTLHSGAPKDNKGYLAAIFLKWRRFSGDPAFDSPMLALCKRRLQERSEEKGIASLYGYLAYVLARDPAYLRWSLLSAVETSNLAQPKIMERPTRAGEGGMGVYSSIALFSALFGGYGIHEGQVPWMEVHYVGSDGQPGLPEGVAAWFRNDHEPPDVQMYNGRPEAIRVGLLRGQPRNDPGEPVWIDLGPSEEKTVPLPVERRP